MKHENNFSDETINAYVDGELEEFECRELLAAASRSPELSNRICQMSHLKLMVQNAWKEPKAKPADKPVKEKPLISHAVAAGLGALSLLAVMSAGDLMRTPMETTTSVHPDTEQSRSLSPAEQSRVVFHISSADPVTAVELLDQVQLVLEEYASQGRPLKVDVVANNQGIRLLQTNITREADRIRELSNKYSNLTFAACGNTLKRLRKEQGKEITILPEAVIIESGVSFVARRQLEGWVYIKV